MNGLLVSSFRSSDYHVLPQQCVDLTLLRVGGVSSLPIGVKGDPVNVVVYLVSMACYRLTVSLSSDISSDL